jgi:hypothetical protein
LSGSNQYVMYNGRVSPEAFVFLQLSGACSRGYVDSDYPFETRSLDAMYTGDEWARLSTQARLTTEPFHPDLGRMAQEG